MPRHHTAHQMGRHVTAVGCLTLALSPALQSLLSTHNKHMHTPHGTGPSLSFLLCYLCLPRPPMLPLPSTPHPHPSVCLPSPL